jgi:hypothetical protein
MSQGPWDGGIMVSGQNLSVLRCFFFLISDSLLTKAMLIKLVLIETSSMGLAMKLKFTSCSHPMQADVP